MSFKFVLGFFLSFLSAFLWGTTYLSGRWLMRDSAIDPVTLSLIRFSGAGALMLAFGVMMKKPMFSLSRREFFTIMLQGMIGMGGMSLFIFWGQRYTGAINSSMIMTSVPVMILLAGAVLGEKVRGLQWIGMAIATVGCFMVIRLINPTGIQIDALSFGDLLIFGAAVCWTVYALWGRRTLKKVDGYIYTTYVMLGTVPFLLILEGVNYQNIVLPSGITPWSIVAYLTIFPTAIAFFAWNEAQRLIGLGLLNIMQYLTPVTVLLLSLPLLGEGCTAFQVAGSVLVISGVALDMVPRPLKFRRVPQTQQ